ncbi:hypothetical protein ACFXI8_27105 [Streptomyces niveus]|uniref:hypothetical protein n=1 Tax=Streptomyces niveus TaxID=193462 RepID=UPI0036B45123
MRGETDYGVALDVDRAGMLMSPESVAEMAEVRGALADALKANSELEERLLATETEPCTDPFALTEAQIEALTAVGNRAVNDAVHEDICACDAWPKKCLSSGGYSQGMWDMGGLETALPAVIALWEGMRPDQAAEVDALRARVAELEAEVATANAPQHARMADAEDTLRTVRAEGGAS